MTTAGGPEEKPPVSAERIAKLRWRVHLNRHPSAFLLLVQLSQAIGTGGLVNPTFAAWIPNMIFAVAAVVLQLRVRT